MARCRVLAPVPQDRLLDDLESLGGDEARDGLPPPSVGLEGDHDGQLSAKLTGNLQKLVRRRGTERRIMEARRAADEDRIVEDQFQTMVVGQIMTSTKPELPGVPGDHIPVPPGPRRKLDPSMPSFDVHPQPLISSNVRQATQRLEALSLTG